MGERGFASLISIIIALVLVLLLMRSYMKTALPTGTTAADQRSAIDAAKSQAAHVEELQKKRLEQAEGLGQ